MNVSSLRFWTMLLLISLILSAATLFAQTPSSSLNKIQTRAERTRYVETSRYIDVMEFLNKVDAASLLIQLTSMGYTYEGRSMPLAIVGKVKAATPEAVKATGKLRVYIQGNIHAGEVEGKEAVQEILRAIAMGKHAKWLDQMVLLINPIYNADGNERVNLMNRGGQHGPIGGMGQRANAQDYDLNRDHTKLDSPEARSLARMMTEYDPHLFLDLHTTNGTRHAYYVTYESPLNPATYPGIIDLLRKELLPTVTKTIKQKDGWDLFYYGNASRGRTGTTIEPAWYTSEPLPRYNNNYVGMRNRLGILCEVYSYLTFEDRIKAARRFTEEVLNYVQTHGDAIRKVTGDADRDNVVGKELALRSKPLKWPEKVEVLLGETVEERNPYSGAMMWKRTDVRKPEMMTWYGTFEASETGKVPNTYYVPATLRRIVDRLTAHGIQFTKLEKSLTVKGEQFRIDSMSVAAREYQTHKERTVIGTWEPVDQTIPAGTLVVPMNQPLARLIFLVLEPRAEDSFVRWNLMDDVIERSKIYPIFRTME
ncbi:MAG: M14 family metallopeptidase [bacterium]